ncbi:MAG: alpha/beta fold hydrolase [Acidobacteriota bacterium]|nr:alpha/beta fold hydrolase [Acidobacteriota bacterium]MDQ7088267.1 alpha/beta fold hydrolase [Acidobacteriota bacterium]
MSRWRLGCGGALLLLLVVLVGLRPGAAVTLWRQAEFLRAGARSGSLVVDDQELAWIQLGPPGGEPLILVHGLRGESTVLLAMARGLVERGYRVIAIDLPGHGRSPRPAPGFDIGRAAELVARATQELVPGTRRPALVGHSMGGWIVALAALEHPERYSRVVLISAAGFIFEPPSYPLLLPRTTDEARRGLPLLFDDPPWVPGPILWVASRREIRTSLDLLRSAADGRYLLEGLLGAMVPPALVIWGEGDRLIPLETGREMAAELGAPCVVVPHAGHMVVWEDPQAVATAIADFIEDD